MRVLNATQMREADRRTIEEIGVPSLVLMENAGREVVAAMQAAHGDLLAKRVAVLCGRGSNGGDGFVVARTLHQRGVDVAIFVLGSLADIRGDARVNIEILGRLGLQIVEIGNEHDWELHFSDIADRDLIVDAIFGTGVKPPLAGMFETVVADVNGSGLPVISIDLPTGLSADTAAVSGDTIQAAMTVTLAAPKLPLVLPPGEWRAGNVVIAEIGIPSEVIEAVSGPHIELLTPGELRPLVEPRAADAHKGDFGHVLVVAGSVGKTGAAHLAAMGALRSGAGLVTIATPTSCQPTLAAMAPEYMTEGLTESSEGRVVAGSLDRVLELERDVIAAGPGLGTSEATRGFVQNLLDRSTVPLVLDADALNVLAGDRDRLVGRDGHVIIITPHPGEMARLVGATVDDVQAHRLEVAATFATTRQVYVVLKGHRTLIATPDGKTFINPTGNPGLATGGTGDVLTGMIAAWLAQLLDAEAACKLAVYLHGLAGDLAEADDGEIAISATDVIAHLGDAVLELTARRQVERRES